MYRNINFSKVVNTLNRLNNRIEERFPDSGLYLVCQELKVVLDETEPNLKLLSKPNYWLRGAVATIISMALFFIFYSLTLFELKTSKIRFIEFIQVSESAVNDIILIGLAIFFLVTVETRIKRSRASTALNELRAIAHIVDMHQLTKDPTEIGEKNHRTASSPHRVLTSFELIRYLDYCSEMLSIVGKIAALYAQYLPEPTVVSTVNEIESLTSGISRKAWQKIMILRQTEQSLSILS